VSILKGVKAAFASNGSTACTLAKKKKGNVLQHRYASHYLINDATQYDVASALL
jgi:hypothetical protein